jgi:putative acetyltransferase
VNVQLRSEHPEDFSEIATLIRASFDKTDGGEVDMIAGIRSSDCYIPELSLVAINETRLVGYAMFHHEWLLGERPARVLDLGPVGVLPEFQGRGVGSSLIRYGLEACCQRREALVMCLGHDSYYPRFGFVHAEPYGIEPFWNALMLFPILNDLGQFRGLRYPHEHDWTQGTLTLPKNEGAHDHR